MTPLDVVKTRLQVQNCVRYDTAAVAPEASNANALRPCPGQEQVRQNAPHTRGAYVVPRTAPTYHLTPTIPMTLAENGQAVCIFPEKCRPQVCEVESLLRERRMNGIWDGIMKVARSEGLSGLWRGLVPTVAMTVPSQVTYMTCYDIFRRMLLSLEVARPTRIDQKAAQTSPNLAYDSDSELYVPDFPCDMPCEHERGPSEPLRMPLLGASLISGALSRSVSATLVTPLELLRTRLQASYGRSSMTSVLEPLFREVCNDGPGVLWRGLSATLWRDVPFSALYFTGYEAGKYMLTGAGLGESQTSTFWHEFGISFGVGATSGCVAAIATQPFDLVKTRLQAEMSPADPRYPASPAASPARSMFRALRHIIDTEGAAGLFRGLSPRLAKVAPSCGIMIGSFEVVGRFLANARQSS